MKSKPSKKPTPKPNGHEAVEHITKNQLQLMSAAKFRQSVALAIDQHAVAIADLDMQIHATREFMAGLSERVDTAFRHIAALDAWQREQLAKTVQDDAISHVDQRLREMNRHYDDKYVEQQAEQKEP